MLPHKLMIALIVLAVVLGLAVPGGSLAQESSLNNRENTPEGKKDRGQVKSVTIPVTPRFRGPKKQEEIVSLGNLTVREDGEEKRVTSVRSVGTNPMAFAVLIQDDVVPSVSNDIKPIGEFIRNLPKGSKVMIAYIKSGSLQVRQKFTTDLDKAARALRIPFSSATLAPYNPYVEIIEGLKRFESLPSGRRAMLVVSDGLDTSRGIASSSASLSMDLQRAIREAQRRSVAIYSIYAPTVTATEASGSMLAANAQSSLERLSTETGGHAYFEGLHAPVSFDPFLRELGDSLVKQLALTFISTAEKGFHKLQVVSDRNDVEIDFPAGYTR